jgi:hypothetical protein
MLTFVKVDSIRVSSLNHGSLVALQMLALLARRRERLF